MQGETSIPANDEEFEFTPGTKSLIPYGKTRTHYQPADHWYGDAHPIYKDGKWYSYYLSLPYTTPNRGTLAGVEQGLDISEDLVNWQETKCSTDNKDRKWWAVANTMYNGELYSMFNDTILNSGYGLVISKDMLNFEEQGIKFPYSWVNGQARDPHLFYNESQQEYWFIYATKNSSDIYDNAQGKIYYSITKDFQTFSSPELLYDPGNCNIGECVEMFKLGDFYYLIMNWGTTKVGGPRYRYATSPQGPWLRPQIDTLQSTDFAAPNSCTGQNKRIAIGWTPEYANKTDNGAWAWGGVKDYPLEYKSLPNGELRVRPAIDFTKIDGEETFSSLKDPYTYVSGDGWSRTGGSYFYGKGKSYGEMWLGEKHQYFDLTMDFTIGEDNAGLGVSFRAGNKDWNGYELFIDPVTNQAIFRTHFERHINLMSVPISLKRNVKNSFRLVSDGSLIECYINDEFALTSRAYLRGSEDRVGIFSEYGSAAFENISIKDLKEVY